MLKITSYIFSVCCSLLVCSLSASSNPPSFKPESFNNFSFIENSGQIKRLENNDDVLYYFFGQDKQILLTRTGISFINAVKTSDNQTQIRTFDLSFQNSNFDCKIETEEQSKSYLNFYNPEHHDGITKVKSYKKITYKNIYKNIDLSFYFNNNDLEFDFVVHRGANPDDIKLSVSPDKSVNLTQSEIIEELNNNLKFLKPVSYQKIGSQMNYVESKYFVDGNIIKFDVQNYNRNIDLVIDPVVKLWGTYFGGTDTEAIYGLTMDRSNKFLFAVGSTRSPDKIATAGAYQEKYGEYGDIFIAKFDTIGNLIWATYYGSDFTDRGFGIVCDSTGNIYIAGETMSSSTFFASSSKVNQSKFGGGEKDGFIAKFNPDGMRVWSTYFGGKGDESVNNIRIDSADFLYFIGTTNSDNYIATKNSFQDVKYDSSDAFLGKMNTDGKLIWSTYYGGDQNDYGLDLTIDKNFNIYFTGTTYSLNENNEISTDNAHQVEKASYFACDAFLAKFDSSGKRIWATFYGGWSKDHGMSVVCDDSLNVYLLGFTDSDSSGNYPIATPNAYRENLYGYQTDGFLVKFNLDGKRQWGTYLGGNEIDIANILLIDEYQNLFISGDTESSDSIAFNTSFQDKYSGDQDNFIMKFDTKGRKKWGTYAGSQYKDYSISMCLDKIQGDLYLAGQTESTDSIATPNTHQNVFGGYYDAFIAKFSGKGPRIFSQNFASINPEIKFKPLLCDSVSIDTTIQLKNNGGEILVIDSIYVVGINQDEFSLLSDASSKTITVDSTVSLKIGFTAKSTGIKSAELDIRCNAENVRNEILKIKLSAQKDSVGFSLSKDSINLYDNDGLLLDTMKLTISNTGTLPLQWTAPIDLGVFKIESIEPLITAPNNDSSIVTVTLSDTTDGDYLGQYIFTDNCNHQRLLKLHAIIKKLEPTIQTDSIAQFPLITCETESKMQINISNTGGKDLTLESAKLTGLNASDFSFELPFEKITIKPSQQTNIPLIFRPTKAGIKYAILKLTTNAVNAYNSNYDIVLVAEKDSLGFYLTKDSLFLTDYDNVPLDSAEFEIINTGTIPISWINFQRQLGIFNIRDINPIITIPYGGSSTVTVVLNGGIIGNTYSENYSFKDLCNTEHKIVLFASIDKPSSRLTIDNVEGSLGGIVAIPIRLTKGTYLQQSKATSITATLRLNASLLDPIGSEKGIINNNERFLPITLPITPTTSNILSSLQFRVTLGNDSATSITLENIKTIGDSVNIKVNPGIFKINGLCKEGGTRLVGSIGSVSLKVSPNPVTSSCTIEFEVVEDGTTKISLYNMLGKIEKTILNESGITGKHRLDADFEDVPSGVYILELRTTTQIRTLWLNLVK